MTKSVTGWLDSPMPGRGVHLAGQQDDWQFRSFVDLAGAAGGAAAELLMAGVGEGDVVCVVLPTDFDCLVAFFGVWAAGATLCPIVPPLFADSKEYALHLATIVAQAQPSVIVTSDGYVPLVRAALTQLGRTDAPLVLTGTADPIAPRKAAEVALLQFTSGSTGTPRGVRVTAANLNANVVAIHRWLGWQDGEGVASWLPLYHDMGLIGCLLSPLTAQCDLWLMRPDQFIRDPARWVACFGDGRARHTAAPAFGYAYAARRVKEAQLVGLDFSGWKSAIVGAEHVDARALDAFLTTTRPFGFRPESFAPAYGLAEATLAVTGRVLGQPPAMARIDWRALKFGAPVPVERTAVLGSESVDDGGWLIGCGAPCGDVQITIADEEHQPLPAGYLGEITVRGSSVADGYHRSAAPGSTSFADGTLYTGDAGVVLDGQLYVFGRMGDSLKIRGRSVYVEDLEAKVVAATGLNRWHCVVVGSMSDEGAGVVVLAEAKAGDWVTVAEDVLRRELGGDQPTTVIAGRAGTIQRTSSGKPRRRLMWQEFQSGELDDLVVSRRGSSGSA